MPLFVNTWLEPVPAQFGRQQGFILDEDGSAESVNMATLEYFPFEEVWNVVMVSKKKLVLQRGGVYKMQKCGRLFFRGRQKTSPLSSGSSSANVSRSSPGCLAGSSACHCRGQASSGTGRTSFGSS